MKNNIKLLSVIILVSMFIGMFSGCSANDDLKHSVGQDATIQTNGEEAITNTENKEESSKPTAEPFAKDGAEFKEEIEKIIDSSKYEIEDDGDAIYYELENSVEYDFDYKVVLEDGTAITLPTDYETLKKAGWTTEVSGDFQIDNTVQRGITFTNANGSEILLWTTNLDAIEEKEEEVSCNLSDCKLYEISFDLYVTDYDDDNIIYEKNENISDFSVLGGITANSSISDVVQALGNPKGIDYYADEEDIITLYFHERLEKGYSSVRICFSAKNGFMTTLKYTYSPLDAK